MTMELLGNYQAATIYEGVISLFSEDMWFLGTMVFVASIAVPQLYALIFYVIVFFFTKSY